MDVLSGHTVVVIQNRFYKSHIYSNIDQGTVAHWKQLCQLLNPSVTFNSFVKTANCYVESDSVVVGSTLAYENGGPGFTPRCRKIISG